MSAYPSPLPLLIIFGLILLAPKLMFSLFSFLLIFFVLAALFVAWKVYSFKRAIDKGLQNAQNPNHSSNNTGSNPNSFQYFWSTTGKDSSGRDSSGHFRNKKKFKSHNISNSSSDDTEYQFIDEDTVEIIDLKVD